MELQEYAAAYSSATVDKDIREFYRAERLRLNLNQADVAADGELEQSTVSRIEGDPPYDPGIKSFLKAIRGLGMKPSEFFARFEQRVSSSAGSLGGLHNRVLIKAEAATQTSATPNSREAADERVASHSPTQIEDLVAAFVQSTDRVVQSVERLAKARGQKPARRTARRPHRRKVG